MKNIFLLPLILLSISVHAKIVQEPVLNCDRERQKAQITRNGNGIYTLDIRSGKEKYISSFKVNGRFNQQLQLVSFGADQGKYYLNLTLNGSESVEGYFEITDMGGRLSCKPDKKFELLKKDFEMAMTLDQETFYDFQDSSLGLKCEDNIGKKYSIRMLYSGFSHLSAQVVSETSRIHLDQFRAENDSVVFFIGENSMQYPPVPSESSLTVLKNGTAARMRFNGSTTELSCREYWAFKTVAIAVAAQANIATSLPVPPGTRDQVDAKFCEDADAAERVFHRYTDLIMGVEGVGGAHAGVIDELERGNYLFRKCNFLTVHVTEKKYIESIKALIGESLEGLPVRYLVTGRVVLH